MSRLVLLVTSPRIPAGLLSADAWSALRAGPVFTDDPAIPLALPLQAAGVAVETVDPTTPPVALGRRLVDIAGTEGVATWIVGADGDPELSRAAMTAATESAQAGAPVDVEVIHGSWDPPGARLLDLVALMDRLRSPGGCPWDAEQTHVSLAPYLLEEAYEAYQALEDEDSDALREELGDVLLQVVFHARVAEELEDGEAWSIDDVAAALIDKLVRRHPHVFEAESHPAAEDPDLQRDWDRIKAVERSGASVVASVPLASPALTLAATLQRKAGRLGVPAELVVPGLAAGAGLAASISAAAAEVEVEPSMRAAGDLLWTVVAALRGFDLDAERALRARARTFRDQLMAAEAAAVAAGEDPATLSAAGWLRELGRTNENGVVDEEEDDGVG